MRNDDDGLWALLGESALRHSVALGLNAQSSFLPQHHRHRIALPRSTMATLELYTVVVMNQGQYGGQLLDSPIWLLFGHDLGFDGVGQCY